MITIIITIIIIRVGIGLVCISRSPPLVDVVTTLSLVIQNCVSCQQKKYFGATNKLHTYTNYIHSISNVITTMHEGSRLIKKIQPWYCAKGKIQTIIVNCYVIKEAFLLVVSKKVTTGCLFKKNTFLMENMSCFVRWYQSNYTEDASIKVLRVPAVTQTRCWCTVWDAEFSIKSHTKKKKKIKSQTKKRGNKLNTLTCPKCHLRWHLKNSNLKCKKVLLVVF